MLAREEALGHLVHAPWQALIRTAGWRNAFAILGAMTLAIGLPFATQVRECPNPARMPRDLAGGTSVREGLSSRIFWIIALVLFLSSIAQNGSIAHLSALLTDRGIFASDGAD
jgi:predicted MFS family arabinose efflux permease